MIGDMGDLLEKGAAWLDEQRTRHMTRSITYVRGEASVVLVATIGRTQFEQADEYGVLHRLESRDFIVRTGDLILTGEVMLPKAGDRIREADGVATHNYEVMAPGNEPPWRFSDPYRKALRIHTKLVSAGGAS